MPYKVAAGRTLFASKNYQAKVLDMFGSSIVAFWPQNESGGTVSRDVSGRGLNGTYTGVTLRAQGIGDGETAASFDGTTSYNNVYSAGLASAFNGAEGTLLAWARVSGAGVWTDGSFRRIFSFTVDANNRVTAYRDGATSNQIQFIYAAGGITKTINISSFSPIIYFRIGLVWSKSGDYFRVYINGTQVGSDSTGLGTWSGALAPATAQIGAAGGPSQVWSGAIGPVLILNRPATAGEIAAASTL